ncbi:hypothetical protein [Tunturiibacter gelidiferens]|uniref:hypothetical protein n=1 Tax=Tunturiibacter gelidiferens TaxID=3069689 RepID=UPI003D9AE02B
MLTVAQPRVPMTACRVGLHKAVRKLAASTSPSYTNPTQSHERLTQSANENTVENNNAEQP